MTTEPTDATGLSPSEVDAVAEAQRAGEQQNMTRRNLFKLGGAVAVLGATAASLKPLEKWFEENDDAAAMFQKHYKELTDAERKEVLQRLTDEQKNKYGKDVTLEDLRPQRGVKFAYALNLSTCIGCRKCAEACTVENNHDRATNQSYIRVYEMKQGSMDMANGDCHYDHEVPRAGHFYMPVQCHQCDNPPCVTVCPTKATWKEEDGIVVIDYNWCIGCRYCEAACPYHARRFNWQEPQIPADELNTEQAYLSNRPRPKGVVEKCTFCLHRTRKGKMPACLEACPTGARVFGNMLDPDSEIRWVLENKRIFVLKEDAGTLPRFFYFFDN